jgi:hypothetical protein
VGGREEEDAARRSQGRSIPNQPTWERERQIPGLRPSFRLDSLASSC